MNLGSFFGGNNGHGGLMPQLQLAQDQQRQRAQDAAALNALKQFAAQQQAPSAPQPVLPAGNAVGPEAGGLNSPQGGPVPIGNAQPALGSQQTPPGGQSALPSMQGMPQAGPRDDTFKMIDIVANMPGLSDADKFAVLKSTGAYMSPLEKYTQQLDMAQQRLADQQQLLDERSKTLLQLQQMRDSTSSGNTNARIGAIERGQDMNAQNVENRITAEERGQDIRAGTAKDAQNIAQQRADSYQQGMQSRAIQGEEGLRIHQQNADTSSDRAGTYKYGTMKNAELKEQGQKERQRLDTAKIARLQTRVSAEDKKPFQAAKDIYDRAAALYQSLTRPGALPAPTPDDIAFAKQKMDGAQAKMEELANKGAARGNSPTSPGPSQEDLEFTAQKYGISVDEVKKKLGM